MVKKIIIVLLIILAAAAVAFGCFCYQNLHWWEKDMKKITKLGVVEKQVTLPNGNVINYGQMGAWEDYAGVMPKLQKNWHIFAMEQ